MRCFAFLMLLISSATSAEVYKWTDADGNVHFGSQPPPGQHEEVQIRESRTGTMVTDRQREYIEERTAPREQRARQAAPVATAPSSNPANSRSCQQAKLIKQRYEGRLDRLLRQGYKQYERQAAENKVAEWEDQVAIYCN